MALMPGAAWRPIPANRTAGGQESVRGVVVHIMAGSYTGTDSWFRNPSAQASSHFGTSKAGALCQWVDTADRAWAQAAGNRDWLSVENEGQGGDQLTDEQLDRNAEVLAWAHAKYGVPLKVADGPSDRGLGYHAMGGSAWGGHTSCPGSKIVAQLSEIVARAKKLAGASEELDMDARQVHDAVWGRDEIPAPKTSSTVKTNPTWKAESFLPEIVDRLARLTEVVAALDRKIDALSKKES